MLVLEELEHAQARGATPLAELVGYGATADASHITLPAPGGIGAVRAARRAFEKAGVTPEQVQHVNAHATSTPEGDKAELQAIKTIFGDHAGSLAITANKSMLGHTLGAAGAIEAITTVLAIRDGRIPPTINLTDPDPAGGRARPDPEPGGLAATCGWRCPTRSGSAGRTPRSSSRGGTHDRRRDAAGRDAGRRRDRAGRHGGAGRRWRHGTVRRRRPRPARADRPARRPPRSIRPDGARGRGRKHRPGAPQARSAGTDRRRAICGPRRRAGLRRPLPRPASRRRPAASPPSPPSRRSRRR